MNQYNFELTVMSRDGEPLNCIRRGIIRDDIAKMLNDCHPYIMFELEEVKE